MAAPLLRLLTHADAAPARGVRTPPALTVVPIDPTRSSSRPDAAWDEAIRAVAQRQDREAFARLFAHFAPLVKRFLMHGGAAEVQAEELAQEAMAAVWRKAALFDPGRAAASTWIFTIARNLRVDAARRRQDFEPAPDEYDFDLLEADEPAVEDRLHAAQLSGRLREALARLSVDQQRVLRLSYFEDEPHSRIAAELGIPLGTVKSRMRAAVEQLRRLLEC